MNILTIFCYFFAFGAAPVPAAVHQRFRTPGWVVAGMTLLLLAVYAVAIRAMPFRHLFTEVPLVLLAVLVISGPVTIMNRLNEKLKAEREAAGHTAEFKGAPSRRDPAMGLAGALWLGLGLPVMAFTLFSLVSRVNYACWLRWECDGRVVAVTRNKGNHNAPMVLVESGGHTESFTQVDAAFWQQAKPGMTLRKSAGSPYAWLDGRRVRMVDKQVSWWNDAE